MTTFLRCSACGMEFGWPPMKEREPAITGHRSNGFGGFGMPSGEFHWCSGCGKVAFEAVAARHAGRVAESEQRIAHVEARSGPSPL